MSDNTSSDPQEIWKPIPGYEGLYSVSNLGRVMSHQTRLRYGPPQTGGHIRVLDRSRGGYLSVGLSKHRKQTKFTVHRLVLMAFLGSNPSKPFANHKNGIRHDPRLENLEWVTASENQHYRYDVMGQQACQGSKHGMAKLTETQVLEIRSRLDEGEMVRDVAKSFPTTESNVSIIKHRRSWTHI